MTLLRRLAEQRQTLESPAHPLTSQTLIDLFTHKVGSGVNVDEKSALAVPAVNRAVSLISDVAGGMPLKSYRTSPEGDRVETRTPVLDVPYPDTTPIQFWGLVYVDLLLWSNAYLYKVKNELGDQVIRLLRIAPWQVRAERGEQTALNQSGAWYRIQGGEQRYGPAEIMHIPALGHDGLVGLSRIGLAREAIGLALAAEQTAGKLFGDGLMMAGVLSSDQDLNETQALGIAARFREALRAAGIGPKIPVLGRGTKFERVAMTGEESQFLEARQFQVLEIARLFGVPPPLLMDPGATSNYGTGLEQQMRFFLITTLDPWLKRVEQAASLHLTPRGQFTEYVRAALLQPDTPTRFEAYAKAIQFGWASRGDVRRWENLPTDDPSLEEFLAPVNMRPSGQLSEATLKEKVDAVGALIRSGFDPMSALAAVGLPAIDHLGLLPVTLQKEEQFDAEADAAVAAVDDGGEEEEPAEDAEEVPV